MEKFLKFIKDEDGVETVEYAIITGFIVVGTLITIIAIRGWLSNKFDELLTALQSS